MSYYAWLGGLIALVPFAAFGDQTSVQIDVTVVNVGGGPAEESRAENQKVWLIPSSGQARVLMTDKNGTARFVLPPASYVSIRIGTPPNSIALQRMSGRFSQRTSVILGGYEAGCFDSGVPQDAAVFIGELSNLYRGRTVPDVMKDDLIALDREIIDLTAPVPGESPESLDEKSDERRILRKQIESLLKGPWLMGVTVENTATGAKLMAVRENGPADRAGLRVGQIITHLNGAPIGKGDGKTALPAALAELEHGVVDIDYVSITRDATGSASSTHKLTMQLER